MENFIYWIFNNFVDFISALVTTSVDLINNAFSNMAMGEQGHLADLNFNLFLFGEHPIISTNVYDMFLIFFGVFYTIIFITIVYKIIKKVFVKVTGWNRW